MEHNITWQKMLRISWAFLWRLTVCLLVDLALFAILSLVIASFTTGHPIAGCSIDAACKAAQDSVVHSFVGPALIVIPLLCIICLKFIVGKDYGDFYLTIVPKKPRNIPNE